MRATALTLTLAFGLLGATGAATAQAAGPVQADKAASPASVRSFRGAPPFKRHGSRAAATQPALAAVDADRAPRLRGKPPFNRHSQPESADPLENTDQTVRFARFEEVSDPEPEKKARRVGPVGKYPLRKR